MTLPEISLVVQSLIFVVFLVSMALRMKGKYFAHVTTMLGAVVLMLSFFVWLGFSMASTFGSYMQTLISPSLHLANYGVHEFLGVATLVSGVWLVGLWRLGSTEFAVKSKRIAQLTAVLWVLAYVAGVLLFVTLNTTFFV